MAAVSSGNERWSSLSLALLFWKQPPRGLFGPIPAALAKSLKDAFLDEEPVPLKSQPVPDPCFGQKGSYAHETRNFILFSTAVRYKGYFSLSTRSPHCWHLRLLRDISSQKIQGAKWEMGKFLSGLLNWMYILLWCGKRNCCSFIPLVSIPEPVLVIRAGFLCLLFVHTLFRSKLVTGIISRLFKILFFLYNGGVVNFGVKKKFYAFSFSHSPPTPH